MSDFIERQKAIDAIDEWGLLDGLSEGLAKEILSDENKVPSADVTEVVRCKHCKHFAGEGMYCDQDICVQFDHFYCYYGEREEDAVERI